MGNLAERYGDPMRSGIYRVSSSRIPVIAAAEAGADLHECDMADVETALGRAFRRPTTRCHGRPSILLVHGVPHSCDGDQGEVAQLLPRLQAAFGKLGAHEHPRFVVLVDPSKTLQLPALWKEPAITPSVGQLTLADLKPRRQLAGGRP